MASIILALILGSGGPLPLRSSDHFDVIELNNIVSDDGRIHWSQFLFIDWHSDVRQFHVEHWTMAGSDVPHYDFKRKKYVLRYFDKFSGVMREITAGSYRERTSTRDYELEDQEVYPKSMRRGLWPSQRK